LFLIYRLPRNRPTPNFAQQINFQATAYHEVARPEQVENGDGETIDEKISEKNLIRTFLDALK